MFLFANSGNPNLFTYKWAQVINISRLLNACPHMLRMIGAFVNYFVKYKSL